MSQETFGKLYSALVNVPNDVENICKAYNKAQLSEKLHAALSALRSADDLIKLQADTILKTSRELVKQCETSRTSIETRRSADEPGKTYADSLKKPPSIILKPSSKLNSSNLGKIGDNLKQALKNVQVKNTRVSSDGTVVVNLPTAKSHEEAKNSLGAAFPNFTLQAPRDKIPRILITNVPQNVSEQSFVHEICQKDEFLRECVDDGDLFVVEKSWKPKNHPENVNSSRVVLKCSIKIRNYIINSNDGYVYLDLYRLKAHDYVTPLRCYHCHRFGHIAYTCPDKEKPTICGFCRGCHESKNCEHKDSKKCINCMRNNRPVSDHNVFSSICPSFILARNSALERVNFDVDDCKVAQLNTSHPKNS